MSILLRNAAARRPFLCAMLATSSAIALASTPSARADVIGCSTSYDKTCTLSAGDTGIAFAPTLSQDGFLGYVENDVDVTATAGSQPIVIDYHATGSSGSTSGDDGNDKARGVDGGEFFITNRGSLTLTGGGTGGGGRLSLIDLQGFGGAGATPDSNGNDGGRGGDGGILTVDNYGQMIVRSNAPGSNGDEVFGVRVVSQGGDGAEMNGGSGDQKGGNGGDAKQITITNHAGGLIRLGDSQTSLLSIPNGAQAIMAYGNGGNGGSENGAGGAGGQINVTNAGTIEMYLDTTGHVANPQSSIAGVYAHSRGGLGQSSEDNSDPGGRGEEGRPITIGNTGSISIYAPSLTAAFDTDMGSGAMFALSTGGDGGASPDKNVGGAGGGAAVNTDGSVGQIHLSNTGGAITTQGYGLSGMVALARGGDGGEGNGDDSSRGGAGGRGGDILLEMGANSTLDTNGEAAYGAVGQSVGGIGGGNASVAGDGGAAGTVRMTGAAGSSIVTRGDFSTGVVLHSLGGGGGVGADFTGVLFGSGGDGGNGANGSGAEIVMQGSVETSGDHSYGLLAQSIGGGGGSGGVGAGLVLGLGGDGGEGGLGSTVTVQHSGSVTTSGYGSNGIVAQSISGGGGAGGASGGVLSIGGQGGASGANANQESGAAGVNTAGDVTTTGDASIGVLSQSIGGGGGSGAGSLGIAAVGGSGGAASEGGDASIFAVAGSTETSGAFSHGLVAQSIGGGGGTGGDVIDMSVGAGLGVGGSGGASGEGGSACISTDYDACTDGPINPNDAAGAPSDEGVTYVTTRGDYSTGVLVQSIGGGGGAGGSATGGGVLDITSLQLGGTGSAGGNGWFAQAYWHGAYIDTYGQSSPGLVVQSIGGGGGSGGSAFTVGAEDVIPLQIGGGGSAGGNGIAAVAEVKGGQVRTRGANSAAVVAQTIGGGGGTGGSAQGLVANVGFGFDVSVGASGGVGGQAGASGDGTVVDINGGASLITGMNDDGTPDYDASDSPAVVAQGIGGGGGMGGSSLADALTVAVPVDPEDPANAVALSVSTAVGGTGGTGGAGGDVYVYLRDNSMLTTGGDGSHGVLAQSIGGGGGAGGASQALSATVGYAESTSLGVSSAIGGDGSGGGRGHTVAFALEDTASITTWGANANGILAQSIGGGGGDGGVGNAAAETIGGGFTADVKIGLGGSGGSGSFGGAVNLTTEAGTLVSTMGSGSRGIVAQSIGGGGGAGQAEGEGEEGEFEGDVTLSVGASGGSGATGGAVDVTLNGGVATQGDDADGVLAQSIGGGGGLGGSAANDTGRESKSFGDDSKTTYNLTLSLGGSGGSGGTGGTVSLDFGGAIATRGDWARGMVLQSIGGGGGVGGTSTAEGSEATANLTLGVGGTGGTGGHGGDIYFTANTPNTSISTLGYGAHAAVLQSIGGGGGLGGDGSDQAAGDLTVGGSDGGAGGAAGNGGALSFNTEGMFLYATTAGDDAYGLLAQSIGGGGGLGGAGNSEASEKSSSHQLQVTVGGRGGASGNGDIVNLVLYDAQVTTSGDRAFGVVAQSIGGGGGVGGAADTDSLASVTVGGGGGASGAGGQVRLDGAHGLVAQSIGGGGGIGGDASGPTYQFRGIEGGGGASGEGGLVNLTIDATITTTGARAHGIVAQSISGGGGIQGGPEGVSYGSSAGDSPTAQSTGEVYIDVSSFGVVHAQGAGSIAILAQADGAQTPGKIDVEIDGSVIGGTGSNGTGALLIDGSNNTVLVGGGAYLGTADGDGYAVRYLGSRSKAQGSYITVSNYGTLAGDIAFENADGSGGAAGVLYNQGTWTGIDRSAADVTNAGTVDLVAEPGVFAGGGAAPGRGPRLSPLTPPAPPRAGIGQARLTGDFTQTREGTLRVTGDFDRERMDLLQVDGTARLGGTLLIEPVTISPDAQVQVISAEGGLRGRFDEIESVLFEFAQTRAGGAIAVEAVDSNLAAPELGLDAQQAAAGRYLDGVFDAGGEGFGAFFAGQERLARLDPAAYAQSLSIFAPGATLAPAAANFDRARSRLDAAQGCDGPAAIGGGGAAMDGQGRCVRMLGGIERRDQQGDASGAFGYDGSVWTTGLAGQAIVAPGWIVGGAAGYEGADYSGDTSTSAEGGTGFLAVSARHEIGAWGLSAGLGGSWGSFDLERRLAAATATAETDVWSLSGRVRADWTMALPHGWLRPSLDVDVVHSAAGGYSEQGAGALNLALASSSETAVMVTPALEVGGETPLTASSMLRGWVRVGATLSSLDGYQAQGRLASANPALGSFANTVAVPDATARLSAGLAVVDSEQLSVEAVYDGAFADGYSAHGGSLRLTLRF